MLSLLHTKGNGGNMFYSEHNSSHSYKAWKHHSGSKNHANQRDGKARYEDVIGNQLVIIAG